MKKIKSRIAKSLVKAKPDVGYNLLMYVEDSEPKIKRFNSNKEASNFVDRFQKKYPDYMSSDSGNWIDYMVSGVTGDVFFFTDGITVE